MRVNGFAAFAGMTIDWIPAFGGMTNDWVPAFMVFQVFQGSES